MEHTLKRDLLEYFLKIENPTEEEQNCGDNCMIVANTLIYLASIVMTLKILVMMETNWMMQQWNGWRIR